MDKKCMLITIIVSLFVLSVNDIGYQNKTAKALNDNEKALKIATYKKCLKETLPDDHFSEKLNSIKNEMLALYNTNANFKYEDLKDGYTFDKNKDAGIYAASVNKLPLVIYAYHFADDNKLNLNEEIIYESKYKRGGSGILKSKPVGGHYKISELLDYAILYSDNAAYEMLQTKVKLNDVKAYFNTLGYDIKYTDSFGETSPEGMSVYAKAAYNYYLKGTNNAKRLINNMKKSDELDVIKNKDFTFALAHKYGYQGIYYNDVSIAFDKHPYTLSIMSTMGNTKEKDNFFLKSHKLINEFNNLYWQEKEAYCKKQAETI